MKKVILLLAILTLSACCALPITEEQKRACLRDDIAMNWGKAFPKLSENVTSDVALNNPDFHLSIGDSLTHGLLTQALKGLKINLSKTGEKRLKGDYISIRDIKKFNFTDSGVISVDIEASAHLKALFAKVTFVVDELSLNIMPATFKGKDGKEYLYLFAVIDYLDISSVPANMDRAIANLATHTLTMNNDKNAALIVNIERLLKHEVHHPGDGRKINPTLVNASVIVSKGNIVLQVARK